MLLDGWHVKDTLNSSVVFGAFAELGERHGNMGVSFHFKPCSCIAGNYRYVFLKAKLISKSAGLNGHMFIWVAMDDDSSIVLKSIYDNSSRFRAMIRYVV